MIKLAVFDVDDTLYDHKHHRIYESSIEAILKVKEQGIKVAIATGRTQASIEDEILVVKPDYIIGCNGNEVVDANRQLIFSETIDAQDMAFIYECSLKYELPMVLKYHEASYIYEYGNQFTWLKIMEDELEEFKFIDKQYARHLQSPPLSVYLRAKDEVVEEMKKKCSNLRFVNAGGDVYDVLLNRVNKSTGIEFVLDRFKFTWDEVFTIGDQLNDVEMVTKAKYGCAVGNAVEPLKKVAKYIALPIHEDGIAKIIHEVILK
ncbi:MAG: HAD family hydrolase [Erysipelotrichaceae bacterium]